MRTTVTKIGDWPAFARLAANLTRELQNARITALRRWGLKAEAIAKGHLSSQDFAGGSWAPLSPRYLSWKARKGYSLNTLIMSSTYFQNITTWVDKVEGEVYVGVKTGRVYKKAVGNGFSEVADIARIQEYGTSTTFGGIPARPLWQPTLDETMAWYVESGNRPGDIFLKNIQLKY